MTSTEFQQLIDALLENDISEADFLKLEAELSVNPAARRQYYERIKLSVLLENEAVESADESGVAMRLPVDSATLSRRWRLAFSAISVIAATLLLALGLQFYFWPTTNGQITRGPVSIYSESDVENAVTGYAVVSGQADTVWEDGRNLTNGSLVPTGELHLRSGVVQLELFSGVVLVVEGAAQFSVISPMEVAVAKGKIRARVPEPAHGFRIRTDEGEVVDLGTEFAVSVTDEASEIHVLDGEVEWQPSGSEHLRLEQGEAVRQTHDGRSVEASAAEFVGSRELGQLVFDNQHARLERWRQSCETLHDDPRLVAHYQFANSDLWTRRLPNQASDHESAGSEGAIVAAAPTSDRWGQSNGALDFSPAGSRVRLTVPGVHRSLTLMCWVKINSLDRWYNSLFLTDGHEMGEPHWQIMDDGRLFFSVKKRDIVDRSSGQLDKHVYYSPPFWNSALSGQWLMIATVYNVDARKVTHYLNGEILSEESIPEEYLVEQVRIGNASLCNWDLPKRDQPSFAVRNLNGSMDEFALFDAPLSAAEIRKMFEDGKP